MEMHNWIFEKLQKKTFLIGAFCASCDANLVEILGLNGIDFVVLDMEHSPSWEAGYELRTGSPLGRI